MTIEKLKKPKEFIRTIAKLSGITNELGADDILVVGHLLKEKYGHLNTNYIKDAFLTYSTGDLGEFEHYNSFTTKFVGRVLKEYKEFRRKKRLVQRSAPVERQIEQKTSTPEQEDQRAFEFIKEKVDAGEELLFANWSGAFRHAERMGYITLSNEEKKKLFEETKMEVKAILANERAKMRPLSQYHNLISTDTGIKIECRKRLLIEYLK